MRMGVHPARRNARPRLALTAAAALAAALLTWAGPAAAQQALEAPAVPQDASEAAASTAPTPEQASTDLRWLTDWEAACAESRLEGRPLLVVSSLPQCPWCRAFDETLTTASVRPELQSLVLVRLDLTTNPQVAQQLGLSSAPVSLLIAPTGLAVDRLEGYVPPGEFLDWLHNARAQVEKLSPEALAAGPVDELISLLSHRDPMVRQLAIGVLTERGDRKAVVEAFADERLVVRLSALDVLAAWNAPLGDADPWKPDTLPPALDRLREWAAAAPRAEVQAPSPADDTERDMAAWMTAEDGPQTQAAYERLAEAGKDLLPMIDQRIPTTWTRARQRLLALRYRLLMPEEQARRLPDIPFKMASASPQTRLQALNILSEKPDAGLRDFFVEAFRDPDGKVREAAVHGLLVSDVKIAKEELAGMLADPSAEVRAMVLRELASAPRPELTEILTAYVAKETEVDLIVQAADILGSLRDRDEAFDALIGMTQHESWRVRAAAVQALGNVDTSSSTSRHKIAAKKMPRLVTALKETLDDDDVFVVAKTVEAVADLRGANLAGLREELAAAARRNTEMARSIVGILAENSSLQPQGRQIVSELCASEDAGVRAAALEALAESASSLPVPQVLAGLEDEDRQVRIVAARAAAHGWDEDEFGSAEPSAGLIGALLGVGARREERPKRAAAKSAKELLDAVRPIASAEDTEERLAGLIAMAALGEPDLAFPGLEEVLTSQPDMAQQVLPVLPRLDHEKRRALFDLARRASLNEYTWGRYLQSTMSGAPRSAEDYLWQVLDEDPYVPMVPDSVIGVVCEFYGADTSFGQPGEEPRPMPDLAEQAQKRLTAKDPVRRAMALVLLRRADETQGKSAELQFAKAGEGEDAAALRRTALDVALSYGDLEPDAELGYLDDADPAVRLAAAAAVAARVTPFTVEIPIHVGETIVSPYYLRLFRSSMRYYGSGERRRVPAIPDGFPVAKLESAAAGGGEELVRVANYLRACRGDDVAFKLLASEADARTFDDDLTFAVALAVAARANDEDIKYVRALYDGMEEYEKMSFAASMFTAFDHMRGPNALKLRRDLLRERRKAGPGW